MTIEGTLPKSTIMKLAAAGLLGMVAISALAQAPPMDTSAGVRAGLDNGDRDSLPRSDKASNTVSANTSETSAPTLPSPALGVWMALRRTTICAPPAPRSPPVIRERRNNRWKWRKQGRLAARIHLIRPNCRVVKPTSLKSGTRFTPWATEIARMPSRSSTSP